MAVSGAVPPNYMDRGLDPAVELRPFIVTLLLLWCEAFNTFGVGALLERRQCRQARLVCNLHTNRDHPWVNSCQLRYEQTHSLYREGDNGVEATTCIGFLNRGSEVRVLPGALESGALNGTQYCDFCGHARESR